jgi:hypothetical protein
LQGFIAISPPSVLDSDFCGDWGDYLTVVCFYC